jgi:hypothetical protein
MKTLKVSLIASLIGTTVGLGSWVFGLGPNHLARSCSNGQLSADPPYDHRDSDYLASAD